MFEPYLDVGASIVDAWRSDNKNLRRGLVVSVILATIGLAIGGLGNLWTPYAKDLYNIAAYFGAASGLFTLGVLSYQRSLNKEKQNKKIDLAEQKVVDKQKAPEAVWELARIKLEAYLSHNLRQVYSIFLLTIAMLLVGFCLIAWGIHKVFTEPTTFNASAMATAAGLVVNLIGVSTLKLYQSTMTQATEYVTVLERINAVGMALQITESLPTDNASDLKNQTTAQIAKQLLSMYSPAGKKDDKKEEKKDDK